MEHHYGQSHIFVNAYFIQYFNKIMLMFILFLSPFAFVLSFILLYDIK